MSQPGQNSGAPSTEPPGTLEQHCRVFVTLGRRLNSAGTTRRAAELLAQAADELIGWDSCSLDLYSPERDTVTCILAQDLIAGQRTEVTSAEPEKPPSARLRQVIADGAQIILREAAPQLEAGANPFGDKGRPSASLLFVPLRCHRRVIGTLTIQSYRPGAYTREDLERPAGAGRSRRRRPRSHPNRRAAPPHRGTLSPSHRRRRGRPLRV